jgi:hypothetical protein
MTKRVQIILTEMPLEQRQALAADAEERNVSRNEALVSVLCQAYNVVYEPARSSFRPVDDTDLEKPITFEVPKKVRDKIRVSAARQNATMAGLVRLAVAQHYGLPTESPVRKPRAPRTKENA